MSDFIPCTTIDEVIDRLTEIVDDSIQRRSANGYFAALYREVTIQVKQKINEGFFDDNDRMEKLDVIFANRYLNALYDYHRGQTISKCWKFAFDTDAERNKIILQHMLLGMNAHINFDLAIATAEVAPGKLLPSIKKDFQRIMDLLSSMIDDVQSRIERVSPAFGLIDTLGGRTDEKVSGFMINKARQMAWLTAEFLSTREADSQDAYLHAHDNAVTVVAQKIANPGFILSLGLKYIRFREEKDAGKVIKRLKISP